MLPRWVWDLKFLLVFWGWGQELRVYMGVGLLIEVRDLGFKVRIHNFQGSISFADTSISNIAHMNLYLDRV